MCRVSLQLLDRQVVPVDIGKKSARRLTVEAGRRDEHVVLLDLAGMRFRVVEHHVVPRVDRWEVREVVANAQPECLRSIGLKPLGVGLFSALVVGIVSIALITLFY